MRICDSQRGLVVRLAPFLFLLGSMSIDALAESFIAPAAGTLYVKCVGGQAGAVSQFGVGTAASNFTPLLSSLPQSCPTAEVAVGHVVAGQKVPFGIHTVWQGADYFAFSTANDEPSITAFSDVYNYLRMGGKVIQQTVANTWIMHLSDAAHYTVSLDMADNIVIQIRLVADESAAPTAAPVMDSKVEKVTGSWSASFSDAKASGQLNLKLTQTADGQVGGNYTSSMGGQGTIQGALAGGQFSFQLTQTVEGCPGTYNGQGALDGDRIVGSYTGSDCLGERADGKFTMSRVGLKEIAKPIQTVPAATPLPPLEDGPLTVTSIAYRVIPHYRETRYQVPGHSNTSCYGSGTYLGGGFSSATADCSTTTTPSQEIYGRTGYLEIFNQVESDGIVFTLRCTARWYGSSCSSLEPGIKFAAEVKGKDMWITGRKGGNMGKEIHAKYQMLDRRPKT
jgi:hypothetical protein